MASVKTIKAQKRKRSRASLVLKILCAAGVAAALTMGATVFFRVEHVVITGNHRYSQEEIQAASGIQAGDNLFHMNKFQIEGELRHVLPYLEEVSIRRRLPNGVEIRVNEWEAAAQVLPVPGAEPAIPAEIHNELVPPPDPAAPELSGEDASSAGDESGEQKEEEPEEELLVPAEEPWLISAGGKLLEPVPKDCNATLVSGLTILAPEAGTMAQVPEEEALKLSGLTRLLDELEKRGLLQRVTAIEVQETTLTFSYMGRFDVKIPLNADFTYKLNFLQKMVTRLNEKHGENCRGQIDLSREDVGGAYLPEL